MGRFLAHFIEFIKSFESVLVVGYFSEECYRRDSTTQCYSVREVFLQCAHEKHRTNDAIIFRSRRERRENPFSKRRVLDILPNRERHSLGEISVISSMQSHVIDNLDLFPPTMTNQVIPFRFRIGD